MYSKFFMTILRILCVCAAVLVGLLLWQTWRMYTLAQAYDQAVREYQTYSAAAQRVIQHATADDQDEQPEDSDESKKKIIPSNLWMPLSRNWLSLRASAREFVAGTYLEKQVCSLYTMTEATQPSWFDTRPGAGQGQRKQGRGTVRRKQKTSVHSQKVARPVTPVRGPIPELAMPLEEGSYWMSSPFGPRRRADGTRGFHYGVDFAALKGTPVYAADDGVVVEARHAHKGYGKTIVLSHSPQCRTRYAHLHRMFVHPGQRVKQGECIGLVGDTGHIRKKGSDGSHLHFEVSLHGTRINPLLALKR